MRVGGLALNLLAKTRGAIRGSCFSSREPSSRSKCIFAAGESTFDPGGTDDRTGCYIKKGTALYKTVLNLELHRVPVDAGATVPLAGLAI
jgi:hypothetical protein